MDPIGDKFEHVSPYNYAENNPTTFFDLHGLQAVCPLPGATLTQGQGYIQSKMMNGSIKDEDFVFTQKRTIKEQIILTQFTTNHIIGYPFSSSTH